MKRCSKCGEMKPFASFHKDRARKDGLQGRCKPCHIAAVSAAIRKNPTRHRIQTDKYRDTHRDRVRETARDRWHRNPKRVVAMDARLTKEEVAALKPIRQAERFRRWVEANPERHAELSRRLAMRYYARKKGAQGYSSIDQVRARWDYYGGRCWMCGAEATQTDHVIPLNRGGTDWPANQRPACAPCNQSKSDTWPLLAPTG
jgi:5-methylcytosine-specific restriction endonuclease McrA